MFRLVCDPIGATALRSSVSTQIFQFRQSVQQRVDVLFELARTFGRVCVFEQDWQHRPLGTDFNALDEKLRSVGFDRFELLNVTVQSVQQLIRNQIILQHLIGLADEFNHQQGRLLSAPALGVNVLVCLGESVFESCQHQAQVRIRIQQLRFVVGKRQNASQVTGQLQGLFLHRLHLIHVSFDLGIRRIHFQFELLLIRIESMHI